MRLLAPLFAATLALAGAAAASTFGPLVTPEDLSARLETVDPIVLDIRDTYDEGHVEGAIPAPYSLFRGPKDNPGQLVDEDTLEARFETLGLTLDRPIVIVTDGETDTDFGAAARVYWTLKSSGFTDLAILNGGAAAWEKAGLPVSKEAVTPEPTELDITFSRDWTADTGEVAAASGGDAEALLLDARPQEFFEGSKKHDAATRPGTVPGAESYAYTAFFEEGTPAISGPADVDALKATLGVDDGEEVVSFCNTGHWAATNWFALSELAGIENVKLYPGSMVEYTQADLPTENTPGLLRNLLMQLGLN